MNLLERVLLYRVKFHAVYLIVHDRIEESICSAKDKILTTTVIDFRLTEKVCQTSILYQ